MISRDLPYDLARSPVWSRVLSVIVSHDLMCDLMRSPWLCCAISLMISRDLPSEASYLSHDHPAGRVTIQIRKVTPSRHLPYWEGITFLFRKGIVAHVVEPCAIPIPSWPFVFPAQDEVESLTHGQYVNEGGVDKYSRICPCIMYCTVLWLYTV